ncbi:MAG: hypothetical protein PHS41_04795, partial [Victivallaceae bacterium]|nr:hypothetical protein [Victivallaceae bacterium]
RGVLRPLTEEERSFSNMLSFYSSSQAPNQMRILCIGDSFFSAVMPYLAANHSEVMRQFSTQSKHFVLDGLAEQIAKFKPDVIIVESTERFLERMLHLEPPGGGR